MQITPEVQRDYDNLVWYKQAAVRIVALFYQIVTPDYATAFTNLVRYFKPLNIGDSATADKTHQAASIIHPLKSQFRQEKEKLVEIYKKSTHVNLQFLREPEKYPIQTENFNNLLKDDELSAAEVENLLRHLEYNSDGASELLIKPNLTSSDVVVYVITSPSIPNLSKQKAQTLGINPKNKQDVIDHLLPIVRKGLEKFSTTNPYVQDEQETKRVTARLTSLVLEDKIPLHIFKGFFDTLDKEFGGWILLKSQLSNINDLVFLQASRIPQDVEKQIKEAVREDQKRCLQSDLVEKWISYGDYGKAFEAVKISSVSRSIKQEQLHKILEMALSRNDKSTVRDVLVNLNGYLITYVGTPVEANTFYFKALEMIFNHYETKEAQEFLSEDFLATYFPSLGAYTYNNELKALKDRLLTDPVAKQKDQTSFENALASIFAELTDKDASDVLKYLPEKYKADFQAKLKHYKDNPPPKNAPLDEDDLHEGII